MRFDRHEIRTKKRDNPEARLVLDIIHYLRQKGYTVGKVKVKGGFGSKGNFIKDPYTFVGFPDLCCFTKKEIVFIEAKDKRGVQSVFQKYFQECCERCGVKYVLARSIDDVLDV